MDLGVTKKVRPLIEAVRKMVNDEIVPLEAEFYQESSGIIWLIFGCS